MKTAFITGSSRGIGREIAIKLAQDGYKVIIHCANNLKSAEETAEVIKNNGGVSEILIADLTDLEKTKELCEKVKAVDILVLNASLQYRKEWDKISVEECDKQLNCNFVSSLLLIQAVIENMKANKWGRIITIGSVQEVKPHPDMLVYSASKAAQTNMMKSLSLQLANFGITVNNIAPGVIYTDRNIEALSNPEYAKEVVKKIPVGFYGTPEDCVGVVSLLCSEQGRYITGQSIFIDGGMSL